MIAARTRIETRDEHESRGIRHAAGRPAHGDAAILERLAEHFQDAARKLRQLIEEQHAVMRERDLAGPRRRAACKTP